MKLVQLISGIHSISTWLIKNRTLLTGIVCILIVVPIILISCQANSSIPQAPFFPVQEEPDPSFIYPTALLVGNLVVEDNCLRIKAFLLWDDIAVWRYGYSLRTVDKKIQVLDNNGVVVAIVGDRIKVGGGEVPLEIIEKYTGGKLPEGCKGPYWLVSNVITDK